MQYHSFFVPGTDVYYSISNAEGKVWLLPKSYLKTGFLIYQPSSLAGRLMKRIFPYLHWIRFVQSRLHIELLKGELEPNIKEHIKKIWPEANVYSVFCGTPSIHQKTVIQISCDDNLLGYCKVTTSAETATNFEKEFYTLNDLKKKGLRNIPSGLYTGEPSLGTFAFIQSTTKTAKFKNCHTLSDKHWEFLTKLKMANREEIAFENSSFFSSIVALESIINDRGFYCKDVVLKAISNVRQRYCGRVHWFSGFHRDFTPWNTYIENGDLFVFDFEYYTTGFPAYLDWFHFFTRTAEFEKHWNAQKILKVFGDMRKPIEITNDLYVDYLVSILSFFAIRDREHPCEQVTKSIKLWVDLLGLLCKK